MKTATFKTILSLVVLFSAFSSCSDSNSIFDPDFKDEVAPDPIINSITPEGGYLAGVDSIIIQGENFSTEENGNQVFFNGQPGIILNATETQLGVRPAQVISDSVVVRVASRGALNFSNSMMYELDQPIFSISAYNQIHNTTGLTRNTDGDIIFNLQNEGGANQGIKVWRTDGTVEDYLPSSSNWVAMKVGPDGLLYGVRGIYAVYREDGGTIDTSPYIIGNTNESYRNLDFGPDDYLWIVGANENIIRADISDASIERFPFAANLRAVRYFNGQLFVGGTGPEGEKVWSFDVIDNELQNLEEVLTIDTDLYPNTLIQEITFDAQGTMYIGSNTGSGIYTWNQSSGLQEMYSGLIKPSGVSFTWVDNFLVASITNQDQNTRHPLKINVLREGAPYLGIE